MRVVRADRILTGSSDSDLDQQLNTSFRTVGKRLREEGAQLQQQANRCHAKGVVLSALAKLREHLSSEPHSAAPLELTRGRYNNKRDERALTLLSRVLDKLAVDYTIDCDRDMHGNATNFYLRTLGGAASNEQPRQRLPLFTILFPDRALPILKEQASNPRLERSLKWEGRAATIGAISSVVAATALAATAIINPPAGARLLSFDTLVAISILIPATAFAVTKCLNAANRALATRLTMRYPG